MSTTPSSHHDSDDESQSVTESTPEFPFNAFSYGPGQSFERMTVAEIWMIGMMNAITDKPDWQRKVFDKDIVFKWRLECKFFRNVNQATLKAFNWCIQELRDMVAYYDEHGFIRALDGGATVIKSDTLIPRSIAKDLQRVTQPLLDRREKDWHPGSNGQVLNLVHPSLYPLTWCETRVVRTPDGAVRGPVTRTNYAEFFGQGDQRLAWPVGLHHSKKFQWLPCEVEFVGEAGTEVRIVSYINNLHPEMYADVYDVVEKVISLCIEPWNEVLLGRSERKDWRGVPPVGHTPLRIDISEPPWDPPYPAWCDEIWGGRFGRKEDDWDWWRVTEYLKNPWSVAVQNRLDAPWSVPPEDDVDLSVYWPEEPDEDEEDDEDYEEEDEEDEKDDDVDEEYEDDWCEDDEDLCYRGAAISWKGTKEEAGEDEDEDEEYDEAGEPMPMSYNWWEHFEPGDAVMKKWKSLRKLGPPEPGLNPSYADWKARKRNPTIGGDTIPIRPVKLQEHFREIGLQVIVKLASIELTPENPRYEGGNWHLEGMMNERIAATAIYYYDVENVSAPYLSFRQEAHLDPNKFRYEQFEHWPLEYVFGTPLTEEPAIQRLGSVETTKERLLVFPNNLQHKVSPFELIDKTRPGHRRFLVLWLVDPHKFVISTANVPPQQPDWWIHEAFKVPLPLPTELKIEIMDAAARGSFMSIEKAKELRLELMKERTQHTKNVERNLETYDFCEH